MSDQIDAKIMAQPISGVTWIDRECVRPNEYNPNSQIGQSHDLLIESIRADGWTQPIVVRPVNEDGFHIIVDGEHRWQASAHTAIDGLIPCVILDQDEAGCIAATVRHNRARGTHGVEDMVHIIKRLRGEGKTDGEIESMLGMTPEERERLEISESAFLAIMGGNDQSMKA